MPMLELTNELLRCGAAALDFLWLSHRCHLAADFLSRLIVPRIALSKTQYFLEISLQWYLFLGFRVSILNQLRLLHLMFIILPVTANSEFLNCGYISWTIDTCSLTASEHTVDTSILRFAWILYFSMLLMECYLFLQMYSFVNLILVLVPVSVFVLIWLWFMASDILHLRAFCMFLSYDSYLLH